MPSRPEPEELPRRKIRKRPKLYRRRRYPVVSPPPDIDMMKLEAWDSDFCGCGQRKVDGALCWRCNFSLDL